MLARQQRARHQRCRQDKQVKHQFAGTGIAILGAPVKDRAGPANATRKNGEQAGGHPAPQGGRRQGGGSG
jgi:hypothetical protein